jgi:hypothetical protein
MVRNLLRVLSFIGILVFGVFPVSFYGQAKEYRHDVSGTIENPYIIPKTEHEIVVDEVLDEAVWQKALVLELKYEVWPGENVAAPVKTEVLLIYNKNNLYAAFRCYDPNPSKIRAHLRDRDALGEDDRVSLIFDTFNDERRSLDFSVTAQGIQSDQSGGDSNWDTIWDCDSKITDWGWDA